MEKRAKHIVRLKVVLVLCGIILACFESCSDNISEIPGNYLLNGPSELRVKTNSDFNVTLLWLDNSNWEDGYILQKSLGDSLSFKDYAVLPSNTTSFSDTAVIYPQIACYYRLFAYKDKQKSCAATVSFHLSDIIRPSQLIIENTTDRTVTLKWQDYSDLETGYVIQRSENPSAFKDLCYLSANTTTFTDSNLNKENTYYYRVAALSKTGTSDYTAQVGIGFNINIEKPVIFDKTYGVGDFSFIPGSDNIAVGGNNVLGNTNTLPNGNTQIAIYNQAGKLIRSIPDYNSTLSISSNGRFMATSGENYVVKVWDIQTGTLVRTFNRIYWAFGMRPVKSALSPDGQILAFYDVDDSRNGYLQVCDVNRGQLIWHLSHYWWDNQNVLEFSPDGKQLLFTDSGGQLLSVNSLDGSSAKVISKVLVRNAFFSPSGKYVCLAFKNSAAIFNCSTDALYTLFNKTNPIVFSAFYFNPEDENSYYYSFYDDSSWNIKGQSISGQVNFYNADEIKLSPDGNSLLIGGRSSSVFLCRLKKKWTSI